MKLADFLQYCAGGVDEHGGDHDCFFCLEHPDGGVNLAAVDDWTKASEIIETMFEGDMPHSVCAMASRVKWSPDESPTTDSWLIVGVERDKPASAVIHQILPGAPWFGLDPPQMPWFALSTAGSLRKVLEGDFSGLVVKDMSNHDPEVAKALMSTPEQVPHPPVDADGRL